MLIDFSQPQLYLFFWPCLKNCIFSFSGMTCFRTYWPTLDNHWQSSHLRQNNNLCPWRTMCIGIQNYIWQSLMHFRPWMIHDGIIFSSQSFSRPAQALTSSIVWLPWTSSFILHPSSFILHSSSFIMFWYCTEGAEGCTFVIFFCVVTRVLVIRTLPYAKHARPVKFHFFILLELWLALTRLVHIPMRLYLWHLAWILWQ